MPTIITHTVVAVAAGKAFTEGPMPRNFWRAAIISSTIADVDVLAFFFGIPYEHFFGHRGFFHSLFFAFVLSIVLASIFWEHAKPFSRQWRQYFLFFFLVGSSHGLLDAMTDGGLGIALLSPFDNHRYFLPWTPIVVSPIGIRGFFSRWGLMVMISEVTYVWVPLLLFLFVFRIVMRKFYKPALIRAVPDTGRII